MSYISDESSGIAAVDEAMAVLRNLHHDKSSAGTPQLIRDLFDDTNVLELFLLKPSGEQRHANLVKVVEIADQLTRDGTLSFGGFVRWLADVQQLTPQESESPMSEEGDDFVRMLTIHKAKGLEFPVVVLADLAHCRARDDCMIVNRDIGNLEFGLGPAENRLATTRYDEFRELEAHRRDAELIRLLYVGTTRARDALIVPWFSGGKTKGSGLLEHLEVLSESATGPVADLARAAKEPGPVAFDTASLDLDTRKRRPTRIRMEQASEIDPAGTAAARERADWLAWRDGYGSRHHRPAAIASPSSADESDDDAPVAKRAEAASPLPPGVTGADIGTVVHEVMEKLDFASTEGDVSDRVARIARAVALAKGLPPATADEAVPVIETGLASDVIRRARRAPRVWRELPFCIAREGGTVEGKIDLVFEEEDGLVVVDYKTNLFDGDTSALREHYRAQAEAYGLALSAVSDRTVKEVVLLFMRGPKEEPIPVDSDPGSVERGLAALIRGAE